MANADESVWSPEAARSVLKLTFTKGDRERVTQLLIMNRDDGLTADERAELDKYLRADASLSVLKSKARVSLKRAGIEP
jgi:hypothetical protein